MHNDITKGTFQAEETSNSEKIKPVALANVKSEGISHSVRQLVSQSVENSIKYFFLNSVATF